MNKFLRSPIFWMSVFLIIIRIPSFFGPEISSDEGYYLGVGQGLKYGGLLYVDVWDNKPPLIYLLYWVSIVLFGPTMLPLRVLSLVLGITTVLLTMRISKDILLFSPKYQLITGIVITILQSFMFEATLMNAENIFVPLVLGGWLLIWKGLVADNLIVRRLMLFTGGISWFLATTTKITPIIEIITLFGVTFLSWILTNSERIKSDIKKIVLKLFISIITISSPILLGWGLLFAWYYQKGFVPEVWYAIFGFSSGYLETQSIPVLMGLPLEFLSPLEFRTIILGLVYLLWIICGYLVFRHRSTPNTALRLLILVPWISSAIYSVLLADRGYPHYLQQLLPSLSIFSAFLFAYLWTKSSGDYLNSLATKLMSVIIFIVLLNNTLGEFTQGSGIYNWFGIREYGVGYIDTLTGKQSSIQWLSSFDEFSYKRRQFTKQVIEKYTESGNQTYFFGNVPEIYALSNTYPAYKLVVDYHNIPGENTEFISSLLTKRKVNYVFVDSNSPKASDASKSLQQNGYALLAEENDGQFNILVYIQYFEV